MTFAPVHPSRISRRAARAFTLVELIVAGIILALVAGATTLSLAQIMRARDGSGASGVAFSRANVAAQRIAADVGVSLRDADLNFAKVAIVRGGPAGRTAQGLLLFAHQNRPVRPNDENAPESDEYEVQYRLEPAAVSGSSVAAAFTLWRRADPVPDDYYDGGGVVSPIADGLVSMTIDAYDGAAWRADWDSDSDGFPHAIRIVIVATDDDGKRTSTARRVIALDRTPAPLPDPDAEEDSSDSGTTSPGSTGSTGSTGTGTTGQGGGGAGGGGGGGGGGR